jgi:hypothetical protein
LLGLTQNDFDLANEIDTIEVAYSGKWLKENGNAIYGTKASIFEQLPYYGASTTKGNTIYLHAFLMPSNGCE